MIAVTDEGASTVPRLRAPKSTKTTSAAFRWSRAFRSTTGTTVTRKGGPCGRSSPRSGEHALPALARRSGRPGAADGPCMRRNGP